MKITFAGHNIRGVKCLETLIDRGYSISHVIGHPSGNQSTDSISVKSIAEQNGIDFFAPEKVNDAESLKKIGSYQPDLMILAGYGQIVHKGFLAIAKKMTINLHGGKLPDYRGSSPLNWMIINGETEAGISIIEVDEGIDTGDILAEARFPISDEDDIISIRQKTLEIFPDMLVETVEKIKNGTISRIKQHINQGAYFPVRTPRDGFIDWEQMSAKQVYNLVRALVKPYPPAFSFLERQKIIIRKTSLMQEKIIGIPGRIHRRTGQSVAVMCKDQCISIETVETETGEPVKLKRGNNLRTSRTILLEELCS